MNIRVRLLLCLTVLFAGTCLGYKKSGRYKVDAIEAIIYGEIDTILITHSEALRPGLDGQPKTLDDTIFENLVYLDAKRIGGVPSDEDIQKHWEEVKKQNGLSEVDMQRIAAQSGYTLQEAKAQLGKMSGINQMFDFKVRSGLFVSKHDVEHYYHEHPEIRPAEYCIARAVVPFSDLEPKHEMKTRLEEYATTGKGNVRIAWSEPFWLKHDQIASDKQFIYHMKIGQVSKPIEIQQGFEIFKIVDKKAECQVPLQERYDEIALLLKRPKYEELLNKYKKELYDKATIVYFQ